MDYRGRISFSKKDDVTLYSTARRPKQRTASDGESACAGGTKRHRSEARRRTWRECHSWRSRGTTLGCQSGVRTEAVWGFSTSILCDPWSAPNLSKKSRGGTLRPKSRTKGGSKPWRRRLRPCSSLRSHCAMSSVCARLSAERKLSSARLADGRGVTVIRDIADDLGGNVTGPATLWIPPPKPAVATFKVTMLCRWASRTRLIHRRRSCERPRQARRYWRRCCCRH